MKRNAGEIVTLDEFEKWIIDGKINGEHFDANEVFFAIQTRIWVCLGCAEEGIDHRIECSLDEIINIGIPICPEGHDMVLLEEDE